MGCDPGNTHARSRGNGNDTDALPLSRLFVGWFGQATQHRNQGGLKSGNPTPMSRVFTHRRRGDHRPKIAPQAFKPFETRTD